MKKSNVYPLEKTTEDENDTMSARDVIVLVKDLGLDISDVKIGKEMTKLGFRKKIVKRNKKCVQVYTHIKMINQNEEDTDL